MPGADRLVDTVVKILGECRNSRISARVVAFYFPAESPGVICRLEARDPSSSSSPREPLERFGLLSPDQHRYAENIDRLLSKASPISSGSRSIPPFYPDDAPAGLSPKGRQPRRRRNALTNGARHVGSDANLIEIWRKIVSCFANGRRYDAPRIRETMPRKRDRGLRGGGEETFSVLLRDALFRDA